MLNYISAEFYKLGQRRSFYLSLAILLVLEEITLCMSRVEGITSTAMLALFTDLTPAGLVISVLCADLVFSNQYRYNTLKNELASGIPRTRIYLGKLFASFLLALLFCAAVCVVYLKNAWLLTGLALDALPVLLYQLLIPLAAVFPLWLGMLSLSFCLFSLLQSALSISLLFIYITFGSLFFWTLSAFNWSSPLMGRLTFLLFYVIPSTPFADLIGPVSAKMLAAHWAVGLGWVAVSTSIGLVLFRRREL